jgi:hypothetical protein
VCGDDDAAQNLNLINFSLLILLKGKIFFFSYLKYRSVNFADDVIFTSFLMSQDEANDGANVFVTITFQFISLIAYNGDVFNKKKYMKLITNQIKKNYCRRDKTADLESEPNGGSGDEFFM